MRGQHPKVMQLLQEYTAAKAAAMQQQPAPQLQGVDRQTAAVTPLGTCSACPSNHRNVSAYYLDLFDRGGLLMDCGGYINNASPPLAPPIPCQACCLLYVPSRSAFLSTFVLTVQGDFRPAGQELQPNLPKAARCA